MKPRARLVNGMWVVIEPHANGKWYGISEVLAHAFQWYLWHKKNDQAAQQRIYH